MAAPYRTHHIDPRIGRDSRVVLEAAVEALGTVRGNDWLGDAGATLHLLASLTKQIQVQLPKAVGKARDQDYSWAEIGDLLGMTRAAAWQRFASTSAKERRIIRRTLQD